MLPGVKGEKEKMGPAGPQLSKTLPCLCSALHREFNTCCPKGQCEMQAASATGQIFLTTKRLPTGVRSGQRCRASRQARWSPPVQAGQGDGRSPTCDTTRHSENRARSPAFSILLIHHGLEMKKTHQAKKSG